jgi:hypothetical protein
MRVKRIGFVAPIVVLLIVAGSVRGSILGRSSGLTTFQDQDRESVFDMDGSNTLSSGDVLIGYLRLDNKVTGTGGSLSPTQEYVVFATQVTSITQIDGTPRTAAGQSALVNFDPVTSAAAVSLGLNLSSLVGTAVPANAMAINFSNVDTDKIVTATGPVSAGFSMFDLISEISSEGSMSTIAGDAGGNDFWQSFFTTGAAAFSPVDNLPSLATVTLGTAFSNPFSGANGFLAGLSVLSADSPLFKPDVPVTGSGGTTFHQVTVTNGQVLGASNADFDPGPGVVNPFFGSVTPAVGPAINFSCVV